MIKKIRDTYYALWADAINYERYKNGGGRNWKAFTFCAMSLLHSFNLMALYSAILLFTGFNITDRVTKSFEFLSSSLLINFGWAISTLFIPSMIIVYFLVFHKKRYEYIIKHYPFRKGRIMLIYYVLTVILVFAFSLLNKFFR